jgi:hypothetical protein
VDDKEEPMPEGSFAVRTVPLEEGLLVHGVEIMGEGPLVADDVVEDEEPDVVDADAGVADEEAAELVIPLC